ncbi:MAG: DUF3160 domain-containing protein [Oliverpabstia sp.]|nr:DUF3160 domain-containing protein [Oliverpabstia sp.]
MFCPKCGNKLEDNAKFCHICGQPIETDENHQPQQPEHQNYENYHQPQQPDYQNFGNYQQPPQPKKSQKGFVAMVIAAGGLLIVLVVVAAMIALGVGRGSDSQKEYADGEEVYLEEEPENDFEDSTGVEEKEDEIPEVVPLTRPSFLGVIETIKESVVEPEVNGYKVKSDLSNLYNWEQFFYDQDSEILKKLKENLFCVEKGFEKEFYETYESNRYSLAPSFVTVDSMMHTYHLYFSYLMKKTERESLAEALLSVSEQMLEKSVEQYEQLRGSEWEEAAFRNVVFFSVGAVLQNKDAEIPADVAEAVDREKSLIEDASGIDTCSLTNTMIDYSQFKPRGYYEGEKKLEKYFRAMMWYGQIGFLQSEEDLDRSALLMTMAMEEGVLAEWERIYTVTSFFAGASDDLTYYEYLPAIEAAYGKEPELDVLVGNSEGWETFRSVTAQMKTPAINSIPTMDDEDPDTKSTEENKGFRFMGQRFTIDAAIFQKLIYENVQEDSEGNKRMLPDTLDVAAALGSDTAYSILEKQGDTDYGGYKENMEVLRTGIKNSPETLWSASLYSNWLYTLKPLLEEKGDGYPDFMQSEEWAKKNLESFAGSYAELKHDTVLYAKQVMAEMGGGDLPQWDDRGYVEPEVQVWSRFTRLAARTRDGLKSFGMLSSEDEENLNRLEQMASQFLTMSEKELKNQLLSDEEYELIRNYGGNLEHFWLEAFKDEGENINSGDFPAAIVTDIATDPNGACLEVGTGNPSRIYVIVPIDGELHICVGAVYSFYQFEQPISERLTDSEWRQMMGISAMDNGTYNYDSAIEQPKWTNSYRYEYKY